MEKDVVITDYRCCVFFLEGIHVGAVGGITALFLS